MENQCANYNARYQYESGQPFQPLSAALVSFEKILILAPPGRWKLSRFHIFIYVFVKIIKEIIKTPCDHVNY